MKLSETDQLTKLGNELYLKESYLDFISENPNSRVIMIDLKKFKFINDSFGHAMGDQCLICFARILKSVFKGDLVARIHGDEFVLVTKLQIGEISEKFKEVTKKINTLYETSMIPLAFGYNAGDACCTVDYDESVKMADTMMYHAKNNNYPYQPFDNLIWNLKLEEELFIQSFEESLNENKLSYSVRTMHGMNRVQTNLNQLYTRNVIGERFLSGGNYSRLKGSKLSIKLDQYNLNIYKTYLSKDGLKYIILINNRTLFQLDKLIKIISTLSKEEISNLVIAIDLSDVDKKDRQDLIYIINFLKSLNVNILLDKCDSENVDYIWEHTTPDYIRFDYDYWKQGMRLPKTHNIIEKKVDMYAEDEVPCVTIFDHIENKEELSFIEDVCNKDTLISGDYISPEKRMNLSL